MTWIADRQGEQHGQAAFRSVDLVTPIDPGSVDEVEGEPESAPGVDDLSRFDPVIHPPHRLRICAVLNQSGEFEFSAVRDLVGVSDSVLSKQVAVLMDAGYVLQRRGIRGSRQRVWLSLSETGRVAFRNHVNALRAIVGG